ncbi:MAG TPA: DUF4231 domain-containing protein [Pseudonocardiaceae bacterium]|jgi:hypothetical protein|nr:DUF4231 domain-containing protein [Pseudonocardiaceae bacterium]
MAWSRRTIPPDAIRADQGLLELIGDKSDIEPREALLGFRQLVSADIDWSELRKRRFRRRAAMVKVGTLVLTALSTVILGIEAIPARASIALPAVALVTVLSALDSFFGWRSRWVLMEETQFRLNRIRDEIDYYLVCTPTEEVSRAKLGQFFHDQQDVWAHVNRRMMEFRKLDRPQPGDRPPGTSPAGTTS